MRSMPSMLGMTRRFQRLQLRLGLRPKNPSQARDAHVVLVEIFSQVGVGLELLEHDAVLLQDGPVTGFQPVLVEKPPSVARPAVDLAAAPVEDGGPLLVDRRVDADDMEIAAGTAGRR